MRTFSYATLRAVPRVDRGEFVNIGVVVYCQAADFLAARVAVDPVRIAALYPDADVEAIRAAADAVAALCEQPVGSARENAGLAVRFGMVVAPRSTVVQPGPVHAGVTDDPRGMLDRLFTRLVG